MRLLSNIIPDSVDPIRAIEWVIAVFTFIGGLYIYSPLYAISTAQNGLSTLAAALAHPLMILLFGAVLIICSLMVMFGLLKRQPHIKSAGWFGIILARSFQLLTTFLTVGFLPITWIFPMTITVVMILLWWFARVEVRSSV